MYSNTVIAEQGGGVGEEGEEGGEGKGGMTHTCKYMCKEETHTKIPVVTCSYM